MNKLSSNSTTITASPEQGVWTTLAMSLFCSSGSPDGRGWKLHPAQASMGVLSRVLSPETRLDQRDLAVEIGLFLCMELEGNAADRGDALQHCERVPGVLERPQGGQSQIAWCQPSWRAPPESTPHPPSSRAPVRPDQFGAACARRSYGRLRSCARAVRQFHCVCRASAAYRRTC